MVSVKKYCIDFEDVRSAAGRIQGVAHRTPVLTSASLDRETKDRKLYFKVEAMQKTGSFKFRGALNAIRSVLSEGPPPAEMRVVTHSSGNHAQALALAARLSSTKQTTVSATIVMPQSTPLVKKAAVEDFGAEIVMSENSPIAREEKCDEILAESGGGEYRLIIAFRVWIRSM